MNDPQLAAALRSRSPEALPDLLDTYGDRLFSYCWHLLRNHENAQIAVRDALVVATAQIGRLVCCEWLGLWLYSLARAECLRREAVPAADADEPIALPHQDDADSRLMAWNAVTAMPADEVEALELDSRHDADLRLVLGLSAAEAEALLERARRDLERALGAEIMIRKSHACPDRPAVLSGWTGTTTPALRDRVLEHAAICSVCGPYLPRSVSPARVFALLPAPALSSVARLEILEFFGDSRMAAYREFTVSRAEEAVAAWFLNTPDSAPRLGSEPPTGSWFLPAPKPVHPTPLATPAPTASIVSDPTPTLRLAPQRAERALALVPEPPASAPDAPTGPIAPVMAQGFIGDWLSVADPADAKPGPATEPLPPVPDPAPRPASRPAPAPASAASRPAPAPASAPSRPAPAPASATSRPAMASEPLAPVIPLTAPPPAAQAPSRLSRPAVTTAGTISTTAAGTTAAAQRPARRRPRVSRVGLATAAAVAVTAVFALVGFGMTPSAHTSGNPPSVAAEGPGQDAAGTTVPPGGGADAALPAQVRKSSGARSSSEPLQQSAAAKTGSLAVAAASQPGTTSASLPGRAGSRTTSVTSASASASGSASGANGTLTVSPNRLDLGRGTTGQLTLTAANGPVSWSADTSSTLVALSSHQGTLQTGQSVTLTITVSQGTSGDVFVFVYSSPLTSGAAATPSAAPSASQAVEVTWTSYWPRGPRPSPSPSDSSSTSPSASPAPSSALSENK
jgi:DNA-directed RNA polymerase specialized sigma24 family protein